MTRHILFVDPEKYHQNAMRRSFRLEKGKYTISLANDAVAALRIILDKQVDILVTETKLPGMDGLELLELVRQRFPHIIRIILSGHVGRDVVLKSIGIAHQYLAKPCDDTELKYTIERAYTMRSFLPDDKLKSLVSRINSLPSLPRIYVEINKELNSEDPSLAKVAQIVSQDLSISAKLLQLVNSSFFGMPQTIASPQKAVSLLGLDLVKAVVLTSGVFAAFKEVIQSGFSVDKLWNHGFRTGALAKMLAVTEAVSAPTPDNAQIAGLLHDIGFILIAAHLPDTFTNSIKLAAEQQIPIHAAEKILLNISHAELGAYLLGLWGLSDPIITAVAYHHKPSDAGVNVLAPLTFVHVANVLEKADPQATATSEEFSDLDWEYLQALNLTPKLNEWLKLSIKYDT